MEAVWINPSTLGSIGNLENWHLKPLNHNAYFGILFDGCLLNSSRGRISKRTPDSLILGYYWFKIVVSISTRQSVQNIVFISTQLKGAKRTMKVKGPLWEKRDMFGSRIKIKWEEQLLDPIHYLTCVIAPKFSFFLKNYGILFLCI